MTLPTGTVAEAGPVVALYDINSLVPTAAMFAAKATAIVGGINYRIISDPNNAGAYIWEQVAAGDGGGTPVTPMPEPALRVCWLASNAEAYGTAARFKAGAASAQGSRVVLIPDAPDAELTTVDATVRGRSTSFLAWWRADWAGGDPNLIQGASSIPDIASWTGARSLSIDDVTGKWRAMSGARRLLAFVGDTINIPD